MAAMLKTVVVLMSLGVVISATLSVVPIETQPHRDEAVIFLCTSDDPLQSCLIKPPNSNTWLSLTNSDNLIAKVEAVNRGDRYLYYGEGLLKGDCGLVIPYPKQEDSGAWLCKTQAIGDPVSITEEITVYVQGSKLALIPVEVEPQSGESVVFVCQFDKPIQSCQIQAPGSEEWIEFSNKDFLEKKTNSENGDRYLYYGDGLDKGDCGIVIPNPQPEDSGIWKCKTKALGDSLPLSEAVDVIVRGTKITVVPIDVEPDKDESVVFICQVNKPIDICQMKPPNSRDWISLKNSDVRTKENRLEIGDRYLYFGEGLEKGDCGIVIPNPQPIDRGMWTCKTKAVGEPVFLASKVKVNIPGNMMKIKDSGVSTTEDDNLFLEAKGNVSWITFVSILCGSLMVLLFGIIFVLLRSSPLHASSPSLLCDVS